MKLIRVQYRARQFFDTLTAPWRAVDVAYAAARLSPALLQLFRRMPHAEQHHGIAVAQTLEVQGYADPALLIAALLHDVGKIQTPPRLWERVFVVLAERAWPERARRWGAAGTPRGWRRGFAIRHQHAAWGATLAEEAGAPARAVALIRQHHAPPGTDQALAALQAADEI